MGIDAIGKTVEGRELEIVRVGNANAPFHVFVRARAHPWESGGNWVAQGLVNRLLKEDRDTQAFRERYCLWLMPMTNKDGVAHVLLLTIHQRTHNDNQRESDFIDSITW